MELPTEETHTNNWLVLLNAYYVTVVAIGNPEQHVRNASHRGSKQQ